MHCKQQARAILPCAAILGLVISLTGMPALAQSESVLKNAPAQEFDEEDRRLFLAATRRALDDTPDQRTIRWENAATGSRGEVTPIRSFNWKDYACRELRIHNEAGGRKEDNNLNLCRIENKWRLVSRSQIEKR